MKSQRIIVFIVCSLIAVFSEDVAYARNTGTDPAELMHERYQSVRMALKNNPFGQPLHLVSSREADHTTAQLSAVLDHPFKTFAEAFKTADNWCELMMLHLNIKYCDAEGKGPNHLLTVFVGRKHEQPLESAYRGEYDYRVVAAGPDYLQISIGADKGPFQTRNYRILLEAVPLDHDRTFIHFTYAYDFGVLARAAQSLYFRTVGRNKVGFTTVKDPTSGQRVHIGGVRGALERNIMRYYLALHAYLNGLSEPSPQRFEKRLLEWFALTERYPLQLREIERNDYLHMKRREFERQQSGAESLSPVDAVDW